jgi:FAD/FMN-containing dehydrogenase
VAPQHLLQVYPVLMAHLPDVHVHVMPTIGLIRAYGQHAPDVTALRRALAPFAGYVVVEIGDDADRWGPAPAGFGMMQALRQSWDPAHKLNPGRYIVG